MRIVLEMSAPTQSALLIFMFLILIFHIAVFCAGCFYRVKLNHCYMLGLLGAVSMMLVSILSAGIMNRINDDSMTALMRGMLQIPVLILVAYVFLTLAYSFWVAWHIYIYKASMITESSIKEAADSLSTGLCFARASGQPILVNRQMEELSQFLCGGGLQNAEQFWDMVSRGEIVSGARLSSAIDTPAVIMPDETAWVFERQSIFMDSKEVVQITAADTTELYSLTNKLKAEISKLEEMNARLRDYDQKVEEVTRSRQRLAMKVQLHDSIGQNLLSTRHLLMQEAERLSQVDAEQVLKKWRRSIAMLRQEAEPEKPAGGLHYLIDAARSAGVEVDMTGNFPQAGLTAELITSAGAEALTNAVRHAGAKTLRITASETKLVYRVSFTNDGRVPEGPLQEGGGLSGLRRRIEDAGGTMSVSIEPEFMLMITIPREGKVGVI